MNDEARPKQRPALQDLLFGLFLCLLAGIVFVATRKLSVGTASDMGPGYVPQAIAWGTLAFGAGFVVRSLFVPGARILPPKWRPLLLIPLAVAVFALLVLKAGLAIASFLAMLIASAASEETRPREILVFSLALSAAAVLVFVNALSLPVPVFPW